MNEKTSSKNFLDPLKKWNFLLGEDKYERLATIGIPTFFIVMSYLGVKLDTSMIFIIPVVFVVMSCLHLVNSTNKTKPLSDPENQDESLTELKLEPELEPVNQLQLFNDPNHPINFAKKVFSGKDISRAMRKVASFPAIPEKNLKAYIGSHLMFPLLSRPEARSKNFWEVLFVISENEFTTVGWLDYRDLTQELSNYGLSLDKFNIDSPKKANAQEIELYISSVEKLFIRVNKIQTFVYLDTLPKSLKKYMGSYIFLLKEKHLEMYVVTSEDEYTTVARLDFDCIEKKLNLHGLKITNFSIARQAQLTSREKNQFIQSIKGSQVKIDDREITSHKIKKEPESENTNTDKKATEAMDNTRDKLSRMATDLKNIEDKIKKNILDIGKYNDSLTLIKTTIGEGNKDQNKFSKSIFNRKDISLVDATQIENATKLLQEKLEKLKLFLKSEFAQDEAALKQTELEINELDVEIKSLNEKFNHINVDCSSQNNSLEQQFTGYKIADKKKGDNKTAAPAVAQKKSSKKPEKSIVDEDETEPQKIEQKPVPCISETKKPDMPNQKLLEFTSEYHADDCHKLLGHANDSSKFISVVFDEAQGNNTKLFKKQLHQLVLLSNKLNRPAVFICKEPGASIHFICGIIKNGQLLLVNPLGENQKICNQVLEECKAEKIISEIWASTRKLQQKKHESKEDFLYSCGPIAVELSNYILTLSSNQLEDFWCSLKITQGTADIFQLLPQNLKDLLQSKNLSDYQQQICKIRTNHVKQLDACGNRNQISDSQAVFHALLMEDFTIENVDQMLEYQSLSQILDEKPPSERIIVRANNPNRGIPESLLSQQPQISNMAIHGIFPHKKQNTSYKKATPEEALKTAMELYLQISAQLATLKSHDFKLGIEQDIYKLALAYYVMRFFNALLEMHGGEKDKIFTLITDLCNLRNPLVKCALNPKTDIDAFVSFCCEINTEFQKIYDDYKKSGNINHEKLSVFCSNMQQSDFRNSLGQEWESYQSKLKQHHQNDFQENIKNLISYLNQVKHILKVVNGSNELKNHPDRVSAAKALLIEASQIYFDFIQNSRSLLAIATTDKPKLTDFFDDLRKNRNKSAHEARTFHDIDETKIMNFKSRIETTILPILNALYLNPPEETMASTSAPRRITGFSTSTITPK